MKKETTIERDPRQIEMFGEVQDQRSERTLAKNQEEATAAHTPSPSETPLSRGEFDKDPNQMEMNFEN